MEVTVLDHRRMNKSTSQNLYIELESVKKEYDDEAGESGTPVTDQTRLCMQGTEQKTQAPEAVVLRRMLFVIAAVAAVALLVAIATLILALTAMKPRNDSTAKVQGNSSLTD